MLENINWGTVSLIVACLAFYLRLVLSSRRREERAQIQQRTKDGSGRKKGSRRKHAAPTSASPFANFSTSWRDWVVAGVGFVFIALGGLLRQGIIESPAWGDLWWVLASLGIVAFSWLFN